MAEHSFVYTPNKDIIIREYLCDCEECLCVNFVSCIKNTSKLIENPSLEVQGVFRDLSKAFDKVSGAATRGVLRKKVFLDISQNFIKKETLVQLFSCEFCEISKNTFFIEHLWTTASKVWRVV